jgi:hypothetical protein
MSDHQFDALDRDMLVEIAISQRAEMRQKNPGNDDGHLVQ